MTQGQITPERVKEEVRHLIAELTEREPEEITDAALFVEDLGVDSLMAIEVMVALDKRYKINIPETDFNQIRNVDDAVSVVMQHVGNTASA